MATLKIYFDRRAVRADGTFPVKLSVNHNSRSAYYALGVCLRPEQWDARAEKAIGHPHQQQINALIRSCFAKAEEFVLQLNMAGRLASMSAKEIKDRIAAKIEGQEYEDGRRNLEECFVAFIEQKHGSTRSLYEFTLKKLRLYCPELSRMKWEQLTVDWLRGFEASFMDTSKNYRNIHLRNLRAVFNYAIDCEDTHCYPFRKFKIRATPTRKRSLSIDELRLLFGCPVDEYAVIYRDLFKLIFMLIGINSVDLHRLKSITSDGRIEYERAKTHRLYSIKVEPEALELIEKYRGRTGLLCIADRWTDHVNFRHQMNKALQRIGCSRAGLGGKKQRDGMFQGLSTYWARHTWATVAASLDIPKETIAAALGHGGNTVTDIYIDFDRKKIDEANRRVLDWVLYGLR